MKGEERIREAFGRSVSALDRRPSMGQGTAVTRVKIRSGLHCEIEDGQWKLEADLSEKAGGDGAAPDPGVLGRSALGSCLAMAYTLWASYLGVPLDGVDVEVQADYDARGQYGVDRVRPSYREVRYIVTLASEAPEAEIERLVTEAEAHCPYLDVFASPQKMVREIRILESRS